MGASRPWQVWAVPDQWSFPLDLPTAAFGIDTTGSGGGALTDTAKGSAAYSSAPDLTGAQRTPSHWTAHAPDRSVSVCVAWAHYSTHGDVCTLRVRVSAWAAASAAASADEFEVKLLRPEKRLGFGYTASEAAVLHKPTKTLALTDALVNVPAKPTAVYDESTLLAIGDNARGA